MNILSSDKQQMFFHKWLQRFMRADLREILSTEDKISIINAFISSLT